jgi:hypothetical protein
MCNESSRTIERAVAEPFAIRHLARSVPSTATATSLNNLATLLLTQGDLMAAMPLFEYIHGTALEPEYPDTAAALRIHRGGRRQGEERG